MARIGPVSGAGGGSGWVKVTDVDVPGGTATSKVYQDSPNNTVLQSVTVSAVSITVSIASSFPIVDVDGSLETLDPAADGGHYEGDVSVTIAGTGPLAVTAQTANGESGSVDTVAITLDAPPTILTLAFTGGYPGAQTQLKAGDTFQLAGTTDKNIDGVEIQDFGAMTGPDLQVVAAGMSFTVTGTIADRGTSTQALAARVRVRDAVTGAYSETRDTNTGGGSVDGTNLVNLNNTYPTVTIGTITYPMSQGALKGSETATVGMTTANLDSIAFSSPTSELSITNPTTNEATKTVTRIGGTYNISTNNFRAVGTRAANGAQTTSNAIVYIAAVAAAIDITVPAARLRSGGNHSTSAQDHTITITSNQNLLSAPTLDADSGGNRGAFQGSFVGGPTVWTRSLRVDETVPDEKGTFAFENLSATNLAGIEQTTINSGSAYTLGGFVQRTLNFPAFDPLSTESVVLVDEAKLSAGSFSNGNPAVVQPFGTADTTDVGKEGWVAPTAASGSVRLRMLHSDIVSSNSTGLTLTEVEETV